MPSQWRHAIESILDRCEARGERRFRGQMMLYICPFLAATSSVFVVLGAVRAEWAMAGVSLGMAVLWASVPWSLWRGADVDRGSDVCLFVLLVLGLPMPLYSGGITAVSMVWFVLIPMIASVLTGGRRTGMVTVLVIVAAVFAWTMTRAGLVIELNTLPSTENGLLQVATASAAAGLIGLLQHASSRAGRAALLAEVEQRRHAEAAALAAQRTQKRFLAVMSHEIRTPLNGVLGLNDLLLDTDLNDEQRDLVATVQASGAQLMALLNDVLDLSRLEQHQLQPNAKPCDVRAVVADCTRLFEGQARQRRIELTHTTSDDLPDRLVLDDRWLRQVLLNLVGNAVKFTEDGAITVRASVDRRCLRLAVQDTGFGMTPDVLDRVFEPFVQADDEVTRRSGGTGLGLSIVRRLVEAMSGTIRAESEQGKGSTFFVTLPRVDAPSMPSVVSRHRASRLGAQSLRILVVDDNAVNRRVARGMCERLGHSVVEAEDGEVAVEACGRSAFDVVLMDLYMPKMDGFDATRRIRARHEVPVVGLSATVLREDQERAIACGMRECLPKPVDRAALEGAIAAAKGFAESTAPM